MVAAMVIVVNGEIQLLVYDELDKTPLLPIINAFLLGIKSLCNDIIFLSTTNDVIKQLC